jgi:hypothetical protein
VDSGIAASAALIVVTVILSTSVLISVRPSSKRFPDDDRPTGLLFHAAHTVRHVHSFPQFRASSRGSTTGRSWSRPKWSYGSPCSTTCTATESSAER